ncbi:PREDICTED: uncharacterized protein LOC106747110 [Dinoponera quadriceps]|uniref:Uncharacterized protein LOC106747110 n=1 Tax=Dinoponera quadriceps TaxID=609295 RepID=A0A6P3XN29_DINQU|nr:PREDICTED: uncharacterized protein LOC106747110 [Dinoponera quadriceps]
MITTPYLSAIQKIPGDTAGEKLKWLGKLNLDQEMASGDIDQLPSELQPILHVENAVRKKIYEDVTSALKSGDVTIVRRALQASWFFNGSCKDVVNVEYFRKQIFPYVSVNTRLHIIKTLALRLKDPQFAREMFTEVESTYGIQYALLLLMVCDDDFAYSTIVTKKVDLPLSVAKKFFRRNMDFMVRYLRLSDPASTGSFRVNIHDYEVFLSKLVKKRLDAFVELYEMHQENPPRVELNNVCADAFLKNGMHHVLRRPHLYMKILPLKRISAARMEMIFPRLMPENAGSFDVDKLLKYLKYYPKEKRLDFLRATYKTKYNEEFLDTPKNVTPDILKLMPAEERIKHARIKMAEEENEFRDDDLDVMSYETVWLCYLPTAESIPSFTNSMKTAMTPDERVGLMWRMLYTCSVNNDEDALLDFMKYFLTRHKNEEDWVYDRVLDRINVFYDLPRLSERIWAVLSDIIAMFFVKYGKATEVVILGLLHYRLLHDMPITETVEMVLKSQLKRGCVNFDYIFRKEPYCKRRFLVTCIELVEEKVKADKWKDHKNELVFSIVYAMYNFNEKYSKSRTFESMRINDYPWLLRTLYQDVIQDAPYHYYNRSVASLFRKHEPELYRSWFKEKKDDRIEYLKSGVTLRLLNQNTQTILDNWKEYLTACLTYYHDKNVHRFVRATRWYKDLPIWFLEYCWENLQQKKEGSYLAIMALLLHGDTVAKLVEPLIPTETTVNISNENAGEDYAFVQNLPFVMKLSNPPVPLRLIGRLCEGDYLRLALSALTSVCRRSPLPEVMSFAANLSDKRVGVTKHGVRMMCLVAPVRQLETFLLFMWNKSKHHSIRALLLKSAQDLLFKNPNNHSWSLLKNLISTMDVTDNLLFSKLNANLVPPEYAVNYIELLFDVIHDLWEKGLPVKETLSCITGMLKMFTGPTCDQLPSSFVEKLMRRYLFHEVNDISNSTITIVCSYLLSVNETHETRMEIFSDIFKKEVKRGWDKKDPKKSSFYPVNYTVGCLICSFVTEASSVNRQVDTRVIGEMLDIFLSVLTPEMDPSSYLLLVYAQEQARTKSKTPEEYGLHIGRKIPELVETFSLMLVPLMTDTLKNLLNICHAFDGNLITEMQTRLGVAEGLIGAGNMESCCMAACLVSEYIPCRNVRYHELMSKLLNMNYPAVSCLLNERKNRIDYNSFIYPADN